ncbi:hypothetical protein [Bowmanella denitrificans]|uniref:hypothetical protein n=1 Tax=Bowmanella denitrificans TaxID=366582 RepID=UPI000C9D0208|nr:hypothetical protein [Bowmanella denitrificans]
MQFELNALNTLEFKAPVTLAVPLNNVDEHGETERHEAKFIGHFRRLSDDEQDALQDALDALRTEMDQAKTDLDANQPDDAKKLRALERDLIKRTKQLTRERMAKYFIGFSKHPKHDFPFLTGGQELVYSPDAVMSLLKTEMVADAVAEAYLGEVNKGLKELLRGNSRK